MRMPALLCASAVLCALGCRGPVPRTDAAQADSLLVHPLALKDCRFDSARVIVEKYCADCHSTHGSHGAHSRALRMLSVDDYAEWMQASRAVPGRIDKDSLEGRVMPPPEFPIQPSDAERRTLAAWVRRGSPNTESGR